MRKTFFILKTQKTFQKNYNRNVLELGKKCLSIEGGMFGLGHRTIRRKEHPLELLH